MSDNIGVVVPSNRPDELAKFKEAWAPKLEEANAVLYEVKDEPDTWKEIKNDLGKNAWIIPVRTDCIRSYGYLQALRDGCSHIVTLDDDTRPHDDNNPILEHVVNLKRMVEPDNWTRTLTDPSAPITRGLPMVRQIILSHGLWSGVPDVPATVQLEGYTFTLPVLQDTQVIPRGKFYPMSGMNLAWQAPLTRYMYFTLQGSDIRDPEKKWGLDRYGDILAGIFSKVMIDNMPGGAIHSGTPYVHHIRASDPQRNLVLEKPGEYVPYILGVAMRGATSYNEMAERMFHMDHPNRIYCRNLALAMRKWYEITAKG